MADPRFKNLELKVGIFILSALVLLATLIVLYGIQKQLFVKKYSVTIVSESGEGLSKGMPIKYSGFQIARVDDLVLRDDGLVYMTTRIPKNYVKWIRTDSHVKLASQNLIGAASLVFSEGSPNANPATSGATFRLEREEGLKEILDKFTPVVENAKGIVANVNTITGRFADSGGDFNRLMRGLGNVGDDLTYKKGSVGYLVRSDYLKDEIAQVMSDIHELDAQLIDITKRVNLIAKDTHEYIIDNKTGVKVQVNSTVTEVQKSIKETQKLLETLRKTVESLSPTIKNAEKMSGNLADTTDNLTLMRKEAEIIADTTKRIMLNLETRWPFSSGSEQSDKVKMK